MHIADYRDQEVAQRYFKPFVPYFQNCQSVVEVASGQGYFMGMLRDAKINATGIELDTVLAQRSKEKGLNVINANFFEWLDQSPPGQFDGAFASHIVEHFSPKEVEQLFALLAKAVKPGGIFVVVTPNIANIRRAVGDFWRDPTHVRPYPIPVLGKLFSRTGWEMIEAKEYTDRKPSILRSIQYGIRNMLIGKYWVGDDLYVVGKRKS